MPLDVRFRAPQRGSAPIALLADEEVEDHDQEGSQRSNPSLLAAASAKAQAEH
jgi:hypothetical protein